MKYSNKRKTMDKLDIEKINKLKSHKDFYQSMINQFYSEALELYNGDEDVFIDYFINDIYNLDEILDWGQIVEGVSVRLIPVEKHENGDTSFLFDYTDEFKQKIIDSGIQDPTEEDIGKYILEMLEKIEE